MEVNLGFLSMKNRAASMKFSVFGLEHHPNSASFTGWMKQHKGILDAKLDVRKNIVKVKWNSESSLTKADVISAIFSFGIAAEELA